MRTFLVIMVQSAVLLAAALGMPSGAYAQICEPREVSVPFPPNTMPAAPNLDTFLLSLEEKGVDDADDLKEAYEFACRASASGQAVLNGPFQVAFTAEASRRNILSPSIIGAEIAFLLTDDTSDTVCLCNTGGNVGGGGGFNSDSLCSLFSDSSGFCGGGFDPIVLDLGKPGLDLTGLDDPVTFDINADGTPDRISWTAGGAADAFLVLDRNGNGTIDDGMELFGDAVMLGDGTTARNGYQALWEFDLEEFGGDGSGVIDANDAVFPRLRLWVDRNHNGVSEKRELRSLRSEGIVALSLQSQPGMELDEHGNFFGFISRAYGFKWTRGRARPQFVEIPAIDVFFLVDPD